MATGLMTSGIAGSRVPTIPRGARPARAETPVRQRAAWLPDRSVSLEFVDCPDRRLTRCAADLVAREAETPGTQVTAILPSESCD